MQSNRMYSNVLMQSNRMYSNLGSIFIVFQLFFIFGEVEIRIYVKYNNILRQSGF